MTSRLLQHGLFVTTALLLLGCSEPQTEDPGEYRVQWVDKAGKTWFAPPVTPAPDDPIHQDHPEPGVVVIDRATRKKRILKDPSKFLQEQQAKGGPPRFLFVQETDTKTASP